MGSDGLLDGAEPHPFATSDGDGSINVRDGDSNGDSAGDAAQVYVAFRTNATDGSYGAGTWVALVPGANPYYPAQLDFTAESALYLYVETVGAPPGAGTNASRVTLPLNPDSDGDLDGNSDFVEFQNGSDPWRSDTGEGGCGTVRRQIAQRPRGRSGHEAAASALYPGSEVDRTCPTPTA